MSLQKASVAWVLFAFLLRLRWCTFCQQVLSCPAGPRGQVPCAAPPSCQTQLCLGAGGGAQEQLQSEKWTSEVAGSQGAQGKECTVGDDLGAWGGVGVTGSTGREGEITPGGRGLHQAL